MQLIGIIGNLMLLSGPLFELYRLIVRKEKVSYSGTFIFLVVVGISLNMLYIIGTSSPIPIYNVGQNFVTITLWCEIYRISRR